MLEQSANTTYYIYTLHLLTKKQSEYCLDRKRHWTPKIHAPITFLLNLHVAWKKMGSRVAWVWRRIWLPPFGSRAALMSFFFFQKWLLTLFLSFPIISIQFWRTAWSMKFLSFSHVSRYIYFCYDPMILKIHRNLKFSHHVACENLSFNSKFLCWQTNDDKDQNTVQNSQTILAKSFRWKLNWENIWRNIYQNTSNNNPPNIL